MLRRCRMSAYMASFKLPAIGLTQYISKPTEVAETHSSVFASAGTFAAGNGPALAQHTMSMTVPPLSEFDLQTRALST